MHSSSRSALHFSSSSRASRAARISGVSASYVFLRPSWLSARPAWGNSDDGVTIKGRRMTRHLLLEFQFFLQLLLAALFLLHLLEASLPFFFLQPFPMLDGQDVADRVPGRSSP